jgi:hypothetical protein
MPHWIALLAIVVCAWMLLAVVGGWLIGRGLGFLANDGLDRARETREPERGAAERKRRAA